MVLDTLGRPPKLSAFYDQDRRYKLGPNGIFVFGSNLKGIHGNGAARDALKQFGAVWGQSEGLQGYSYGIPTRHRPYHSLTVEEISENVKRFRKFVDEHPRLWFLVTAIACGHAGHKPEDIAPMFNEIKRCWLPSSWQPHMTMMTTDDDVEDDPELEGDD